MKREPILHTASGVDLRCTWLNPSTQQAKSMISRYEKSEKSDICQAYKSPSTHKVVAFNAIKEEMVKVHGTGMKITGAGCDFFSCAYTVKDGSDIIYLIYHTPSNRFCIEYKVPDWIEATRL